jgi:hypothetical protein
MAAIQILMEEHTLTAADLLNFLHGVELTQADGTMTTMPVRCRGIECTEAKLLMRNGLLEIDLDSPVVARREIGRQAI